ncbi:transcriptional regulator [[Clostridium] sordellii]|uniref:Stage 0 sporulation protein A homolog n=1 Tax=Paraclostridium sordellii TaxID=1505 RepID=A0A9P1P806_PARSO|nr:MULTISPECIES: LytTR family DNA-binding domain-containing protein [Paeniclostridium]AUN14981.1 DNA-binding response regulator [Paeniclostridium sordellii]EPZ59608.1 response regulator [[Clostridium] sordellii VPI 9048] [Paeniclostridium sordellii VPI 9048]MBS6024724.1 response regulator transcription factor [Paeniclostridium sordellii]MBW4862098.1 LytTR family DNA-binding domain-containing protein [Paeniclostridium sp.]MBW4875530.1 LytTR family DNA-binding domain-containing protein [Paeniclo
MKIAICDDEKLYRIKVKKNIYKTFKNLKIDGKIFEYESGENLLEDIEKKQFDLIILDIVMNDMDGINTAKEIREIDKKVCIVFFTNYNQYAIQGYGLNVYRYLIKNLDEEKISEVISNIYEEKKFKTIVLKSQKEVISFDLSSIYFFEVNNRIITMHYEINREYKTREFYGKLDDLELQLKGESFFRSHRSYIVNIKKIRKIVSREIFFDILPKAIVSRSRYLELKRTYMDYNIAI